MKKFFVIALILFAESCIGQVTAEDSCLWFNGKKLDYYTKIERRSGTDSVFGRKCKEWVFLHTDSIGSGGGGSFYDSTLMASVQRLNDTAAAIRSDFPSGGGSITAADKQVIFSDGADNPVGNAGLTFNKTTGVLSSPIFTSSYDASNRIAFKADIGGAGGTFYGLELTGSTARTMYFVNDNGDFAMRNQFGTQFGISTSSNGFFINNLSIGGVGVPASATKSLSLFNGTIPSASVTDGVILYAEDASSSSELRVRDEAGNITPLSPHNFGKIPSGRSEKLAWSFYSERGNDFITADMTKALRTIEKQSKIIEDLMARVAKLEGKPYKKKKPVKLVHTGKLKK